MKDTNVAIPEKFRMDTAQRKITYFLPSEHLRSLLMGCYINQVVLWRQFFLSQLQLIKNFVKDMKVFKLSTQKLENS